MSRRSEEWDENEDRLDRFSRVLTPKVKEAYSKALDMYHSHSSTHNWIKIIIKFDGEIKKLECGECNWNPLKKWWEFWK